MNKKRLVLAIIMLIPVFTDLVRADFLYAITMDEEFLSVDPATGAGRLIGRLDSSMDAFDLSTWGNGIYTYDQKTNRLKQLDPLTAHTLKTIDIGIETTGEGSLAFRSDGVGFLARSSGSRGILWSFDLAVPNSTMIGDLDFGVDGLDFNAEGILYGLSQMSYGLYTINPANAQAKLIGSTGLTSRTFLGGLAFSSCGTLYGVLDDALYTLDPGTGAATLIGPIGYDNVSGLAATCPVPSAALLCGLGAGIVDWLSRRKKFL